MKAINWIRGRAPNHRLFKSLYQDYSKEYFVLLFHTEVRWLSRGRALTRFFELRNKVKSFLKKRDYEKYGFSLKIDLLLFRLIIR